MVHGHLRSFWKTSSRVLAPFPSTPPMVVFPQILDDLCADCGFSFRTGRTVLRPVRVQSDAEVSSTPFPSMMDIY